MATKRQILESLSHKDLLSIAEDFELSIDNRRRKGNVIDALVTSRTARLTSVLEGFSLAQLKETCRKLEIKVNGRTKVDFIEGLLGKKAIKVPTATAAKAAKTAKIAKTTKTTKTTKTRAKKASAAKTKAVITESPKAKAKEKPKAEVKTNTAPKPRTKTTPKTAPKAKSAKPVASPKKKPPITRKAQKAEKAPTPLEAAPPKEELPSQEAHPTAPDYSRVQRPTPITGPIKAKCIACKKTVQVVQCQANECSIQMVPPTSRKICAGCWFDRSGGSFDVFLTEYKRDTTCPACEKQWGNFDD